LISIASHEIRGPVASLLGLTSVFNIEDPADPFNAEVIQFVQSITRQLDRLLHTLVEKTYSLQQEDMIKHYAQQNRSVNE
jgi:signal transduction histidine kinase